MGTDIHPAVEVRRKGGWRYHRPTTPCKWYNDVWEAQAAADYNARIAVDPALAQRIKPVKAGDRRNTWDRCKTRLPVCFSDRNYAKFAVLGDVRNGYGFAGVETFKPIEDPLSSQRGLPDDADPKTIKAGPEHGDHSEGYVTLQELLDYDFTVPLHESGVVSEAEYLDCLINHHDPENWSGGISGPDIVTLTPEQYLALFGKIGPFGGVLDGTRAYNPNTRYFIHHHWEVPLAAAVPDVLEMIEYLKGIVPEGGTPEDVRVLFSFDS